MATIKNVPVKDKLRILSKLWSSNIKAEVTLDIFRPSMYRRLNQTNKLPTRLATASH